jgi:hypothetical protein
MSTIGTLLDKNISPPCSGCKRNFFGNEYACPLCERDICRRCDAKEKIIRGEITVSARFCILCQREKKEQISVYLNKLLNKLKHHF